MNPFSDTSFVEIELEDLCHNHEIPKEDIRLFVEYDAFNYIPVETHIDSSGNFVVEDDPNIIGLPLYLGTRRQFLHERVEITSNSLKLELSTKFKTGWDPKNYIIFQNGMLLNSVLYKVYCPNFDTEYCVKVIYNRNIFKVGDYIDIFYIEADDRFKNIRFNHDVYIKYVDFVCESANQKVVQIPYPYASYPRQTEMFFIFNKQTKRFMFRDVDYKIDTAGLYVVLDSSEILVTPNKDIITFVFPYCQSDYENDDPKLLIGEKTGTSFTISSYQWIPDYPTQLFSPNPIIEFKPKFESYTLEKDNFLLFHNNVYMHPSRYELVDNNHIKLLSNDDIMRAEFEKYTMLIYEETSSKAKRKYRSFELDVYSVTLTSDGQKTIDVPPMDPTTTNFMVFYGSLMMDVSNKFELDYSTNKIIVNDSCLDEMKAGRELVFVFYTNEPDHKRRMTMELVKIKFYSNKDGSVEMTNDSGYKIDFNKKNCIIFMNGTYLDPDRYNIIGGHTLIFNNPLDQLRMHKAFTGCFLIAHVLDTDLPLDILDDIRDGYPNKLLWFDEIQQAPEIEKVTVTD